MPVKYKVQKGDTLNKISQRHGFKNYRDAGITSVPSGNFDLIRPGEEIEIGNARSGVGNVGNTPIVTSQDAAASFKRDSDELDAILSAPRLDEEPEDVQPDKDDGKKGADDPSGVDDTTYNTYRKSTDAAVLKAEEQAEDVLREYDDLYALELAAIDQRTRSTVNSLRQSFRQRINEQKRINKINVDRVKAYGLSSGQAMMTPIMWSDAITEREREGAEEVQSLELERKNLIDAAKAAKEESNAALLAQKIKDYNAVKDKLNQRLKDIEAESKAQYKELRRLREEQEAEFEEKKAEQLKRLQAYYRMNPDEVEGLDDAAKEELVNELADKYGFENYEVLGVIDEALAPDFEAMLNEEKINSQKALTQQREASAANSWASAAKRRRETEKLDEEDEDTGGDYSSQEERKLRQVGLANASVEDKDAYLYGSDDPADANYVDKEALISKYEGQDSGGGDVQSRAESAGYDYAAMKEQGYSDEEIAAALDEAGV